MLHFAASKSNPQIIALILAKTSLQIDETDVKNENALMWAIRSNKLANVEYLVCNKADFKL